jgi:hypothetical protein
VRALKVGSIVEGSDATFDGAVFDLLTDAAYADLIATLEREVAAVDALVRAHLAELDPASAAPSAAPTSQADALAVLADLVDQLDGIGVPEWRGAEGLSLEAARAAIAGGASAATNERERRRDAFAAAALTGLLAHHGIEGLGHVRHTVDVAWDHARVMLLADDQRQAKEPTA